MFDLIESDRREREEPGWTGRIVSALIHVFLLSLAIALTRDVLQATPDDVIEFRPVDWTRERPTTGGVVGGGGHPAPQPVPPIVVTHEFPDPGELPPDLPPGDPLPVLPGFDSGATRPPGSLLASGGSQPLTERQVDEQPELLTHPALRYPDVLRRAGIEGRVMVEVVLDSLGRAEPGSARVASSSHQLFDPEAVAVVSGSVYRPARVSGRAVRVRVRVPVSFTLRT